MITAAVLASTGAPQAQAKAPPAIPGMEQGNPSAGRPVAPSQPGAGGPLPGTPQTAEQIRTQIQDQIRTGVRNGGTPQIVIPSDFVRNAVPQGAVDISIAFFVTIASIVVLLPFSRAMARLVDRRTQTLGSGAQNIAPQIAQLQESVDAMAVELERITEAQRFQSKLLAGREKEPEPARLER